MKTALRALVAIPFALALMACAVHLSNSGNAPIPEKPPGALRIATHNAHYILLRQETGRWSLGDWESRRSAMDGAFKEIDADVFAFQEMESFAGGNDGSVNLARDYLLDQNPGYQAAAAGDWRQFPSTQPIFYRTSALRFVDQGWFFFSETPDVIYSRTFDGGYPAFASWARFELLDRGQRLLVLNVHFDYGSQKNRRLSAELVRDRMEALRQDGEPVFLVGDLNERLGSAIVKGFEATGLEFAPIEGSTYHFDRGFNLFGAIDHIAVEGPAARVAGPVVLRRRFADEWPSDHYPVFADYRLAR